MYTTILKSQIQEAFQGFTTLLSPLSNEQLNQPPQEGNWTIGQLAQHVVLATAGLGDEKTAASDRPFDQHETSIRETFLNSKEKFQAPEFIKPEKKDYDGKELIKALQSHQELLIRAIDEKKLNALCLDIELPGWGHLTRYEWLKLIVYHVQRHTKQLKKLIALQTEKALK